MDTNKTKSKTIKSALILSPGAGAGKGHNYVYALRICTFLSEYEDIKLTILTTAGFKNKINADLKFKVLEFDSSFNKALNKSNFLKYKAAKNIVYGIYRMIFNFVFLKEIKEIAKEEHFDIIHLFEFEYLSAFIFFLFNPRYLKKAVLGIHISDFKIMKRSWVINFYKIISGRALKFLIKKCSYATVHGEVIKYDLRRNLKLPDRLSQKINVIPYGTDEEVEKIDRETARRKIGIDYDGKLALFFGMIRSDKGLDTVLKALGIIENKLKLLIAGSPANIDENTIKNWVRKYNCEKKVFLNLKYIPDEEIKYFFCSTNFIILAHKKEHLAHSGPLCLSTSYSLPVLASEVGETGYYVQKNKIGLTFEPDNFKDLAKNIEIIMNYDDNQIGLLKENLKLTAHRNSWKNMSKKIHNIYENY